MDALITKAIVDAVIGVVKAKFGRVAPRDEIQANIERHVLEALAWSNRVQFYGMAVAEETDANTIPLALSREPRRFFSHRREKPIDEYSLLNSGGHYIVLGNVGAGKTTTLKRLTRHLIVGSATGEFDTYQCPVVVICRELRNDQSLFAHLATTLAIPFSERRSNDDTQEPQPHQYWCRDEPLQHVLARVLNQSEAVLIVDGLDELAVAVRDVVNRELEWLARNLRGAKIITSARAGDYTSVLEGFELLEICALSRDEIVQMSRVWLPDDYEQFLVCLDAVPYADIVDRPLLLSQLLFLYKRYNELPEQPSEVYKSIIELLLREWDAERRIVRRSRYARFDARRKLSFLAAIAYELTYKIKVKQFSETQLQRAYASVCDRFALPKEEMTDVIAELETHTGLIELSARNSYEFSHLSLQEYLCADYLVRDQFAPNLGTYMREYPSPVAIAVTLSSNPSGWLEMVIRRCSESLSVGSVHGFFSRLLLERPLFSVSEGLGLAMMILFLQMSAHAQVLALLNAFCQIPNVLQSIKIALPNFRFPAGCELDAEMITFWRAHSIGRANYGFIPEKAALPSEIYDKLRPRWRQGMDL